jgi:glutathione S-transferase
MTLYTTTSCAYCDRVKDELDRRGLEYEEVTVTGPRSKREEVYRLTGQRQVPVLVDHDVVVHDSTRILDYLRRRRS